MCSSDLLQQRSLNSLPNTQERLELSRRLHDGLAQDLAALGYSLDSIIGDVELPSHLRDELRLSRLQLSAICADFRDEIYRIRLMDRNRLRQDLRSLLIDIDSYVDLEYPVRSQEVEDGIGHALLEIIKNAIKHGNAKRVEVKWQLLPELLEITITDNGARKPESAPDKSARKFGEIGLREWIASLNGKMIYKTNQEQNIHKIELPLYENVM